MIVEREQDSAMKMGDIRYKCWIDGPETVSVVSICHWDSYCAASARF